MKHTNENLASRDDDYISKLVNIIELKKAGHDAEMWQMTTFKDYCNSPNDIVPIATENRINSIWNPIAKNWESSVRVETSREIVECYNDNRLRAMAECYILLNQGD